MKFIIFKFGKFQKITFCYFFILFCFIFYFFILSENERNYFEKNALIENIEKYALKSFFLVRPINGFIILAMLDSSSIEMALNFYHSSLEMFNIDNYLFVAVGNETCSKLNNSNIHCFHYTNDLESESTTDFGSKSFIRKMNIRTEMILQTLKENFSLLHTDMDVVFLQNPINTLLKELNTSDAGYMLDIDLLNAGFSVLWPSPLIISMYEEIKKITSANSALDDQTALNMVIKDFQKKNKIQMENKVKSLNTKKFLCGRLYFDIKIKGFPRHPDVINCEDCLVIHNNFIVTQEAKVYRFKESLLWSLDTDQYYSNPNNKFLSYYNPFPANLSSFSSDLKTLEQKAFKSALTLSHLLGRILILPRFHCQKFPDPTECSILHWYKMRTFHKNFAGKYRENRFFQNSLVPLELKKETFSSNFTPFFSFWKPSLFMFNSNKTMETNLPNVVEVDLDDPKGIIGSKCLERLRKVESPVLNIYSLIGIQINSSLVEFSFRIKLKQALKPSKYIQL